jgi:hypothetical protein
MDMDRAVAVIGIGATQIPLRNMVTALGLLTYLNTPEDWERREAAQYVLKRWKAYQAECNKRRDAKFKRRAT